MDLIQLELTNTYVSYVAKLPEPTVTKASFCVIIANHEPGTSEPMGNNHIKAQ